MVDTPHTPPGATPTSTSQRSALEIGLGLVTEVRAGEGLSALLLTLNVFLLLTAYYVIKPVREALILSLEGGANIKSYLGAAIAIALLFIVPAYARFAQKLPRNRLVVGVTLFFASHVLAFYVASLFPAARGYLGVLFFIWAGVFSMMVVAQFWSFANDIYDEEQGKRLFALLGLGASGGAAAGSQVTKFLIGPLGTYNMLLVGAAGLVVCALLTQIVHVRESDRAKREAKVAPADAGPKENGAFRLVLKHRYLALIAAFTLLFTFVNTNGEFLLGTLFKEAAVEEAKGQVSDADVDKFLASDKATAELDAWWQRNAATKMPGKALEEVRPAVARAVLTTERTKDILGRSYGGFFFWVNVLGVLIQTFFVSRVVKYLGMRRSFLIFPGIALASAGAAVIAPVLATVRLGKTAENATDYSLNNTLRNMLWLPTTREMKYQAKQAIDSFFVRMGDVGSAALVYAGSELIGLGVRGFAAVNLVLVVAWLYCALKIVDENQRMSTLKPAG